MSERNRILIKIALVILGAVFILFIFLHQENTSEFPMKQEKPQEQGENVHIPVVEIHRNALILALEENELVFLSDGKNKKADLDEKFKKQLVDMDVNLQTSYTEKIADIVLTDKVVTDITIIDQKICDKVLAVDENSVLFEKEGRILLSNDYKGYRLLQTLEEASLSDIPIGYEFTDFWMKNNKICAFAIARLEAMDEIRVLIKSDYFEKIYHEKLELTADCEYEVRYEVDGREDVLLKQPYECYEAKRGDLENLRVCVTPKALTGKIFLKNVKRSTEGLGYRGRVELTFEENGIVVVNVLPLEEYLYSVVPSEMPASYPMEALKAQAICARTYAYGKMFTAGYPSFGAHVDDSTSYQVYNNINEQENTNEAVRDTFGQMLYTNEYTLVPAYYYSTSCGISTDCNIWKNNGRKEKEFTCFVAQYINGEYENIDDQNENNACEKYLDEMRTEENFRTFILSQNEKDFDYNEAWYRWKLEHVEIDTTKLYEKIVQRHQANEGLVLFDFGKGFIETKELPKFKKIKDIWVEKRGVGGVIDELCIETDKGTFKIISEYNIRYCLSDDQTTIQRKDGTTVLSSSLLPSGFFVIDLDFKKKNVVGYTIIGGGYGHGVGMSQNAAKNMAVKGYSANEILQFFYKNCEIEKLY